MTQLIPLEKILQFCPNQEKVVPEMIIPTYKIAIRKAYHQTKITMQEKEQLLEEINLITKTFGKLESNNFKDVYQILIDNITKFRKKYAHKNGVVFEFSSTRYKPVEDNFNRKRTSDPMIAEVAASKGDRGLI